jgi:hypothetical protein
MFGGSIRERVATLSVRTVEQLAGGFRDGRFVVTGGYDQRIRVWDMLSPESLHAFTSVTRAEQQAAPTPDDDRQREEASPLVAKLNTVSSYTATDMYGLSSLGGARGGRRSCPC